MLERMTANQKAAAIAFALGVLTVVAIAAAVG
jgi:hypothetical protein